MLAFMLAGIKNKQKKTNYFVMLARMLVVMKNKKQKQNFLFAYDRSPLIRLANESNINSYPQRGNKYTRSIGIANRF